MMVRRTVRLVTSTCAIALAITSAVSAQEAGRLGTLRGFAYDSLLGRPLVGATITVSGSLRTVRTGASGTFEIDSVPAGLQTVALFEPSLDSLGVTGLSRQILIPRDSVVSLATASFATLWRSACGGTPPPSGGVLFGNVVDARRVSPIADVTIYLTWLAVGIDSTQHAVVERHGGQVHSDSIGRYAACGVPVDVAVRLLAVRDSMATSVLDEVVGSRRARRIDLWLGPIGTAHPVQGVVQGRIEDELGQPLSDARVGGEQLSGSRTDSLGHFILNGVPVGTRQLEVTRIGFSPGAALVDVRATDTSYVGLRLRRLTELSPMLIVGTGSRQRLREELDRRRSLGVGRYIDSTQLATFMTPAEAVSRALPNRPICAWFLDGVTSSLEQVAARNPLDVALVEVHEGSDAALPVEYQTKLCARPLRFIALVWTKNSLP